MKGSGIKAASLLSSIFAIGTSAQGTITDPKSGVVAYGNTFPDAQTTGGFSFGIALPPTASAGSGYDYIGVMTGSRTTGGGWSGISHNGGMPNSLLLMAWADGTTVRTSFRFAAGYVTPDIYTGNATLTKISETVNSTHFTLSYLCQSCFVWDQGGATGSQPALLTDSHTAQVVGWVQASEDPTPVTSNSGTIVEHDNGMGIFGLPIASAVNDNYSKWAASATPPTPTGTATPTSSPTSPAVCTGSAAPTGTYDYIVVGAGAAGIPIADKLSESGKSVLLIEKGPPSSGRWGGTLKPDWLAGTNLTRFDVPGLCNEIWVNSGGIACTGIDQMAGCVLGGGTAVNAALWWKPPAIDWDYNFPSGWKSNDMSAAVSRVFSRIPGTDHPSRDGKLYKQEGYTVLSTALANAGWKNLTSGANAQPDSKNKVFAQTPYMFANGERGGPMATYLVTANARKNFKMITNASVRRVIRTGGHATGVELESGYCGVVNVTATTGRVILAAGVFNTAKVLFRSGIGPTDQLTVVKNSAIDGSSMISNSSWINLPVGKNLDDHTNTDIVFRHPNVSFYDFYAAYDAPIVSDRDAYLKSRTGILTQAAPNIGPMFWEVIPGSATGDNIDRQMQYTARVEPSLQVTDNTSMTISQYLGRGSNSRGTLSINGALNMQVSDVPYLKTKGDIAAVKAGLTNVLKALATVPGIVVEQPAAGVSVDAFVNAYPVTTADRRSNHWIGTAKIGSDSGLTGGSAVVDLNTRVYGTDNVFVVDASIFPGMVTTNPSSLIVSVAERAAELIGKMAANTAVAKYGQCGGSSHTGSRLCAAGSTCVYTNDYYSQCL